MTLTALLVAAFFLFSSVIQRFMAYESATHDGFEVESSSETADQIRAGFAIPDETVVEEVAPAAAEPEPVVAKGKPRDDPKARMLEATAKEAAAKRERDEAKAESAKLAARIAELEGRNKPEPVKAPAVADAEPTVDQFDSYEKFVDARARWAAKQEWDSREQARTAQQAQKQRDAQNEAVDRQFGERYNAILTKDPDFASKVHPSLLNTPRSSVLPDPSKGTFGNFLVEQVFQSEHPEALLLHLSNVAEVQRLATLPPMQVIRELARVEARLGAASPSGSAPVVPAVSQAKAPIQPLGTSHGTAADPLEITGDESVDEHIRKYNAADRRARRG